MRQVAVVAVLVAALVSGCASEPNTDSVDESGSGSADASSASSVGGANATSVLATLVANLTAHVVNGTAPLVVSFTIGATPANATATWNLTINGTAIGNGTGVPATANHTFLEGGLWNVTLSVADGVNTATAVVAINVTVNNTRAPLLVATYTNKGLVGGPYVVTNDPTFAHLCLGFNLGQDRLGCVFLKLPTVGAHDGLPGIVTTDAGNFRFAFYSACGPTGTAAGFAQGSSGAAVLIPAGTGCVVAWTSTTGNFGTERTFTLDVYDWLPPAA